MQKGNIKIHLHVFTCTEGSKWTMCAYWGMNPSMCGKRFTQKWNMKIHAILIHQVLHENAQYVHTKMKSYIFRT